MAKKFEGPGEMPQEEQWRQVQPLEVIGPDDEVKMNLDTGESYVRDSVSDEESIPEDLEVSPEDEAELEAALEQEFPEDEAEGAIDDIREAVDDFVKEPAEEEQSEATEKGRDFYARMKGLFANAAQRMSDVLTNEDPSSAQEEARALLDDAKQEAEDYFGDKVDEVFAEQEAQLAEAEATEDDDQKMKLLKIFADGLDFIPIAGPAKMIVESGVGKTLSAKEMSKRRRLLHATEGVAFLALDLSGIGVLTKGAKASKLMTRSAALMRKLGVSSKAYKPVYRLGKLLLNSPAASRVADKILLHSVAARASRKVNWAKKVPEVLNDQETENAMAA